MQNYEKAAMRYLQLQGYEQIGARDGFLVCIVENGMAFVHVAVTQEGSEQVFCKTDRQELRDKFEHAMLEWFEDFPADQDYRIFCDELSVNVISSNRAFIRHHQNVMEAM